MPEDDEYKNSSKSNENRSEEPQSDLNDKGFEQYVNKNRNEEAINEDGNKDAILDKDYLQDSESISQESFIVKPKSADLNKDVSSDTYYASDQIKDTSGEQISNTDNYYHFESDDHSENISVLNENVDESEQDYSSSQESSSQVSSQTPITYSASSSQNVSQQSSEKSSTKSPINEQSASTSALNSTEQESSSSGSLKSEGKSSTLIKSENASSGPLKSEGESSTPLKSESTSSSPLKSKSASSDSVLKDQGTSSRGLRKSASTGDLKKSKSSILKNKDKNKDKGKKDKDKDSKKNNTSMAKALNVASSISNVLKVNDEQNVAENIINNVFKELKNAGVRMAKSKLKNLLIKKCLAKGIAKAVAKKAVTKALNQSKYGAIISAPFQAWDTFGNLYSGNVGDIFKDAAMSLASGDPVPIIVTAVVIGIVILFGLSLIGNSFSENSKVNPTNYVENIEVGESSGSEVSDDDEEEGNPFNATAMINFNNTFSNLNDYFYKYSDDSNNMLSNSLKKSDQSIDLMKKLAKKLVQTRQFKYSIFDDYFIKYFFDEVTEKELKDKVKSDIKNSGMLFTETYIGKAIQTNKLYNSFKKDLDDYKTKINQIKTNTEKAEGEDENAFKNKVINEFKTQNPNADSIYLTCYKLFSDSVDNLKIVKNIDMNLENRWENTKELTNLLYFIKNINDIDENRNLNIEANDLENILKSLEDEMTDLNVSIIGKNLSGEDLDFNYVYGSKRKKTSLYLEKEFLNTCDVKYQEIIDGIGEKEDISAVNLSDYKNIMDNAESWSLIRNLQIFESLINEYKYKYAAGETCDYVPNDLLLGNNLDEDVGNQDNENDGSEEDGGEEETYDFNNCLYKVYSIIQEKMAENFGTSKYNGSEEKKDESIVTSVSTPVSTSTPESYERKNNNIFYGIPEIDVTEIDKIFYFPTEMISVELLNTPGVSNSQLGTSSKAMNVVKKDEIIQRVEDLIPLLIDYQNIVKDVQEENKNEISDLEKRVSDVNASNDFIVKGDEDDKYIYEDSEIDDLFAFDDLSTIEIDEEKYYVFDNISELSEIRLDLSSKDFLTWFKNEEDDTSFYNNYIPEAFIFDEDDELEDMEYLDDFAEMLKDKDEDLKSEIFQEANQQYEKLSSDSAYDLSEEYIAFKYLLFGGIQNFEPVLNQVWEENIFNVFGNFTTEKTNLASDDIPFTNSYNDYIDLNMPVGKEIYAICSGKVVAKTDNSITIRSSEQLFDESNYIFYVEYTNLSPNVNVGDEVFRYPVPTEDYFEQDANGNIKDSTIIGKAKTEDLQIKCYICELKENFDKLSDSDFESFVSTFGEDSVFKQKLLINPRLIIQDDDGLPIVPYLPFTSSTEQSFAYPSYKMYTLPPKVETPRITPYLEPPDPLHRKLLFVFGTITYYVGLLYAIWAIIKFALGLHDYESANYQAIWQFIAASVLIFGALILKYLSGL